MVDVILGLQWGVEGKGDWAKASGPSVRGGHRIDREGPRRRRLTVVLAI